MTQPQTDGPGPLLEAILQAIERGRTITIEPLRLSSGELFAARVRVGWTPPSGDERHEAIKAIEIELARGVYGADTIVGDLVARLSESVQPRAARDIGKSPDEQLREEFGHGARGLR